MILDNYYLKKEVPSILDCSDTTISYFVRDKRLTKIKAGNQHSSRVFFDKKEVDNLKKELRLERLNRKKFDIKDFRKLLYKFDKDRNNYNIVSIEEWIDSNVKV